MSTILCSIPWSFPGALPGAVPGALLAFAIERHDALAQLSLLAAVLLVAGAALGLSMRPARRGAQRLPADGARIEMMRRSAEEDAAAHARFEASQDPATLARQAAIGEARLRIMDLRLGLSVLCETLRPTAATAGQQGDGRRPPAGREADDIGAVMSFLANTTRNGPALAAMIESGADRDHAARVESAFGYWRDRAAGGAAAAAAAGEERRTLLARAEADMRELEAADAHFARPPGTGARP
jgi:hypothetical protein